METFGVMSPVIKMMFFLNWLGWTIKRIEKCPDWVIPMVLPVVGAVVFPFMGDYSVIPKTVQYPWMVMAFWGFGIGWTAVGGNQAVKQFVGRNNSSGEEPPTVEKPTETK